MFITIYDIMGNMANDPRTNVLDVTKGNGFLELKSLLKHDHFACKPTQFTFLVRRQHFGVQKFKTIKGEKNQYK
jgi:hypothetical protein